jgi:uncharacterized protein YjdB
VRPILIPLGVVVAAVCGSACGDSDNGPVPISTLTVSPQTATVAVGASTQLTATPEDGEGNEIACNSLFWVSTAPGVAAVSSHGLVTGVVAGSAFVRATCQDRSDSAAVVVTPAPGVSQ